MRSEFKASEDMRRARAGAARSLGRFGGANGGPASSLLFKLDLGWLDPDATFASLSAAEREAVLRLAHYAALRIKEST